MHRGKSSYGLNIRDTAHGSMSGSCFANVYSIAFQEQKRSN